MTEFKTYSIKGNVSSDWSGYSYIASVFHNLKTFSKCNLILDFSGLRWIDANLASVLGVILKFLQKEGYIISMKNINSNISNIFLRNGFLNMANSYSASSNMDTVVNYWEFGLNQDDFFYHYIREEILAKDCFPRCSERLQKELTRNIFELYSNACLHGKTNFISTCGQHYPQKYPAKLDFTIVNLGTSIFDNVNGYLSILKQPVLSAHDSIRWATVEKNSTKKNRSGGLGLSLLIDFIRMNKGKIQIVSDIGYWEYQNGICNIINTEIHHSFPGTIVTIEFNVSNTSDIFYRFKDERPTSINNLF